MRNGLQTLLVHFPSAVRVLELQFDVQRVINPQVNIAIPHGFASPLPPPKPLLLAGRDVQHGAFVRFDDLRGPVLLLQHLEIVEPSVVIEGRFLDDGLVLVLSLGEQNGLDVVHRAVLLLEERVLRCERVFGPLQVLQRPFQNRARAVDLLAANLELGEF